MEKRDYPRSPASKNRRWRKAARVALYTRLTRWWGLGRRRRPKKSLFWLVGAAAPPQPARNKGFERVANPPYLPLSRRPRNPIIYCRADRREASHHHTRQFSPEGE